MITLCSLHLPNLEWPFVREWLDHHRAMGVERFYLWAHIVPDNWVWLKKPFPERYMKDSAKALELWQEAVAGDDVVVNTIEMEHIPGLPRSSMSKIQIKILREARDRAIQDEVDWLGFIDVDEFIGGNLVGKLAHAKSCNASILGMRQRVMAGRWDAYGDPISVYDIDCGMTFPLGGQWKWFARPRKITAVGVHYPSVKGKRWVAKPKNLRLYHFRGRDPADDAKIRRPAFFECPPITRPDDH